MATIRVLGRWRRSDLATAAMVAAATVEIPELPFTGGTARMPKHKAKDLDPLGFLVPYMPLAS